MPMSSRRFRSDQPTPIGTHSGHQCHSWKPTSKSKAEGKQAARMRAAGRRLTRTWQRGDRQRGEEVEDLFSRHAEHTVGLGLVRRQLRNQNAAAAHDRTPARIGKGNINRGSTVLLFSDARRGLAPSGREDVAANALGQLHTVRAGRELEQGLIAAQTCEKAGLQSIQVRKWLGP